MYDAYNMICIDSIMTSENLKSSISDYIIIRVCTLAGFLLIASGSARSYEIVSFLGEILIPTEITMLLWTINFTLILSGLIEIVAVLQILRDNYHSGKQIMSVGLLMALIVLVVSIAQQLLIPLHFYDFIMLDLIGWFGIGILTLVRLNMK
jgi:hypothetical protein